MERPTLDEVIDQFRVATGVAVDPDTPLTNVDQIDSLDLVEWLYEFQQAYPNIPAVALAEGAGPPHPPLGPLTDRGNRPALPSARMPAVDVEPDQVRRWHFGDRYLGITLVSAPTSMDLELTDLGPGAGRGVVAIASYDDDSGEITVRFFTEDALPIALVEQLLGEAQKRVPPSPCQREGG